MIAAPSPLPIEVEPPPAGVGISDEAADLVAAMLLAIVDEEVEDEKTNLRRTAPT